MTYKEFYSSYTKKISEAQAEFNKIEKEVMALNGFGRIDLMKDYNKAYNKLNELRFSFASIWKQFGESRDPDATMIGTGLDLAAYLLKKEFGEKINLENIDPDTPEGVPFFYMDLKIVESYYPIQKKEDKTIYHLPINSIEHGVSCIKKLGELFFYKVEEQEIQKYEEQYPEGPIYLKVTLMKNFDFKLLK